MSDKLMKPSDLIKRIQDTTTEWQVRDLADFALPIAQAMEAVVEALQERIRLEHQYSESITHKHCVELRIAHERMHDALRHSEAVEADFARTLEREITELQTRLAHLQED